MDLVDPVPEDRDNQVITYLTGVTYMTGVNFKNRFTSCCLLGELTHFKKITRCQMSYVYTEYHVKLNGEKVTWLEVDSE